MERNTEKGLRKNPSSYIRSAKTSVRYSARPEWDAHKFVISSFSIGVKWFRFAISSPCYPPSPPGISIFEASPPAQSGRCQAPLYPDGHLKIPHLWPPQNTPPTSLFYPTRQGHDNQAIHNSLDDGCRIQVLKHV